ncbi:MAG: hypothetical protein KDC92_16275, partial [Bacteroidetes bacterium]|nr:hypothetical protein [Bacteroidota bacterium]
MNYWNHFPNRDEVLEKIYAFLKNLSENKPEEAEKLVRIGSMPKFRDSLHYYLTDYYLMQTEDSEVYNLPDDFSVAVSNPENLNEN